MSYNITFKIILKKDCSNMKLKKRQIALIEKLYNSHKNTMLLTNFFEIDAANELCNINGNLFKIEYYGFNGDRRIFQFTITNLGYMPDFLKG